MMKKGIIINYCDVDKEIILLIFKILISQVQEIFPN